MCSTAPRRMISNAAAPTPAAAAIRLARQQQIGGKDTPAGNAEPGIEPEPFFPHEPAKEAEEKHKAGDVECPVVVVEHSEQEVGLAPNPGIADSLAGSLVGSAEKECGRKDELGCCHADPAAEHRPPAGAKFAPGRH